MGLAKTDSTANKRAKKTKAYFDKRFEGIMLSNSKKRFCGTVASDDGHTFFQLGLINDFGMKSVVTSYQWWNEISEGMKSVVTSYQVLKPSFPSNTSHLDLEVEAKKIF